MLRTPILVSLAAVVLSQVALAADPPAFDRKTDVVYGRKHGMALTMDVFTPKEKSNGAAVIWVVSGGWFSSHDAINSGAIREFLNRGYTVFAVVHGSQPRYTIPEITEDMNRSVRYHPASRQGLRNRPRSNRHLRGLGRRAPLAHAGDGRRPREQERRDPVDQTSSRIQAVACFFPPTDFLNYGKPGENAVGRGVLAGFKPPFDFQEQDPATKVFRPITDEARIEAIARQISPVNHVSSDDPPTLIIHGDADLLVPIQQAELILEKLKSAGVETKLVVKKGAQHGWPDMGQRHSDPR